MMSLSGGHRPGYRLFPVDTNKKYLLLSNRPMSAIQLAIITERLKDAELDCITIIPDCEIVTEEGK